MKLSIRFYLDKSKFYKQGNSSIKCRLTLHKIRKEFSTGVFIQLKHWNSKQQLVKPPEPDSEYINSQLSLIRTKLSQAFYFYRSKEVALQLKISTSNIKEKPIKRTLVSWKFTISIVTESKSLLV